MDPQFFLSFFPLKYLIEKFFTLFTLSNAAIGVILLSDINKSFEAWKVTIFEIATRASFKLKSVAEISLFP